MEALLNNPVALIVAILGSAGFGGFFREIVQGIKALRSGVSAKEANRKRDLVSERDYEYDRAEAEARNRRRLMEYSTDLRVILRDNNLASIIPDWPRLEKIPDRVPGTPAVEEFPKET